MDVERLFGRRILVAEDEYFVAFDLADFLERAGADVVGPVSNTSDAMHLAQGPDGLDIAVVDVNLQDGCSFELADALRASGKPFLFLTGHDRHQLTKAYPDVPVLEKPFDYQQLLAAIGDLLAPTAVSDGTGRPVD